MILSDRDIKARIAEGKLGIENFNEKCLTPNGYDLSIHEVYTRSPEGKVTIGTFYLDSGAWCLVSTAEFIEVPHDLCGMLWMRSSFIRKGLVAGFGLVDAGFKGTLTFSVTNVGPERVALPIGERICQLSFCTLSTEPRKLYSGKYQGQRGITLEGGRKVE